MSEESRNRSLTPTRNRKIKFIPKRNKSTESEKSKTDDDDKDLYETSRSRRSRSQDRSSRGHKSKSKSPQPDKPIKSKSPKSRHASYEDHDSSILNSPEAKGAIEWLTSSIKRGGSSSDDKELSDSDFSSDESELLAGGNYSTGDIDDLIGFGEADSDEDERKSKKSSTRGRDRGRDKERGKRSGSLGRIARSLSKGATDRVRKLREQREHKVAAEEMKKKKDQKKKKKEKSGDKQLMPSKEVKKKLRKKKPGELRVSTLDWDDDPERTLPKEHLKAFDLVCEELGI
jgi:hypothetical protein